MEPSIKDVARVAGVSPTTVSHTLSGKRRVSDELAARVRAAMEELEYAPSRSARNLALGTTQIIGLLVPDIGNAFFAELAKGVEEVASREGYNVIIGNIGFDHSRGLSYLGMIRARAVDGIVYAAGSPVTDDEMSQVIGKMPLVLVDEVVSGSQAPLVTSENRRGGQIAAEHLLALGHRDAVVLAAPAELITGSDRVDGFVDAWVAGGGTVRHTAVGGFTAQGGELAIRDVAAMFHDRIATAVFAVNDEMAIGALRELRAQGISVPDQVSVVGFDDIRSARDVTPALTTVRQDMAGLGARAAEILLHLLSDSHNEPYGRTVPVQLIDRESTCRLEGSS